MRKAIFLLLLLAGCSTGPTSIQDVSIYDNVKIRDGIARGCSLEIRIIAAISGYQLFAEEVCGKLRCDGTAYKPSAHEEEALSCMPFEYIKVETTNSLPREPHLGVMNR